jgi:hypothetical protein
MIAHVISLNMFRNILKNPRNVQFNDLLNICIKYFGQPRTRGSHHIFKTPWIGDPRINIQKDGKMAKPYQVKSVLKAIIKLEENDEQIN